MEEEQGAETAGEKKRRVLNIILHQKSSNPVQSFSLVHFACFTECETTKHPDLPKGELLLDYLLLDY